MRFNYFQKSFGRPKTMQIFSRPQGSHEEKHSKKLALEHAGINY
jgi:hypothetical protein